MMRKYKQIIKAITQVYHDAKRLKTSTCYFSGIIDRPKMDESRECLARVGALANSSSNIAALERLDYSKNKKNKTGERSIIVKLMEPPERLTLLALSLKVLTMLSK
ncbi:hypothetical protein EVAR_70113_1 [Eumeta japonica]|uniref:Uncharacterized protein n=1 Tax=Eumeta variegata TaxID=151549 RepID=A0A4C1SBD5_EUMVA|nr:hypothetical protein EVAR_70113_1 [Eumeta japonica]